jgi:3'-phosphoadenosine 5'-phosphosulfate sulfotransferase (PAPS reductase)/FAD synthetase
MNHQPITVTRRMLEEQNITLVVSVSGGKDSTATLLQLIEWEVPFMPAFADTGNEHEATLEYVDKLPQMTGCPAILKAKADFAPRFEGKRKFIANDSRCPNQSGRRRGWTDNAKKRALEHLHPTGNPFLDLCMLKGRFPSRRAQFCTQELKQIPIYEQVHEPLIEVGKTVWSVQGVRWDESRERADRPYLDADTMFDSENLFRYLPILHWTVEDVFAMHRRHGVDPNPLYLLGMGRVGCMPCINAGKAELFEITRRFPHHFDRIREWERIVGLCSKRQESTFFAADTIPTRKVAPIDEVAEWSRTVRGGRQFDLLKTLPPTTCSSMYGLCE